MVLIPSWAVWTCAGVAVLAVVLSVWQLARRYPSIPDRVPLGLRLDGRPRAEGRKSALWAPLAVLVTVIGVLIAQFALVPPDEYHWPFIALVFVVLAEIAWYLTWTVDRVVEMARGMTVRIAPTRMLLTVLPVAATLLAAIVLNIAASL